MAAKPEGGGAYLSSFVDAVLEKLTSILEDDSVLNGNHFALELLGRLEKSLYDVGPVLDDAEQKQFTDKRVKKWLVDLQDTLYMADDLLEELSTKATIAATQRDPGNSSSSWSRLVDSYIEDNGDMESIVALESVVARKNYYHLKEYAKVDVSSWRIPSTSLVVSSGVFGRDKNKEEIIKLLLDDTCHAESPVTVIPIVGLGGIGKTTLAQLVYRDAKVMGNFDTRIWVCVAEDFDVVQVTRAIRGAIEPPPRSMNNFDLHQTDLMEKLKGKTFLIVLDDVWHDQRDTWEDFLKPFQYGNNGSKFLLTTRSEKVASVFTAPNRHYQLSLLSDKDCWSVFLKHSSISTNSEQYATLEPIGKKIVEKCKGLPLAVKTLGGLLRNKYDVGDWENISESEIWELPEDDSKISTALRVSYHYLPSHLKRCFVYCSLYPEDYQFDKDELILLWMAEDLIQPIENKTLESIGCAYFNELVVMSFFQPSSKDVSLFVMHDLMHDLATLFAKKFYFRVKDFEKPQKIYSETRHLSYTTNPNTRILRDQTLSLGEVSHRAINMRTFLDTNVHYQSIFVESDVLLLILQLRCLRVLSFKYFQIESLPDSIGKLIHLHYLDLSFTPIVMLSESLCKLYNLQTLKLQYCRELKMLPSRMQDLVNLHHLNIQGASSLKEMPKEMSKLKDLNFLSTYIVGRHEENGIRELGALDNLHGSLCISSLENVNTSHEALEAKVGNKKHIHILELKWLPNGDVDVETERDILDKLQPHRNLKQLTIYGYRCEIFPDWLGLSCYSNITKLRMYDCKNCRQLPSLGQLPSLQRLEISTFGALEKIGCEFYKTNESCQQTPFKSLEILEFKKMFSWREWQFPDEFDGFPKLRCLSMYWCPKLIGDLPAHLLALEELTIDLCEELACSLPRAPQLQQLLVKGELNNPMEADPHEAIISETQLGKSILECLRHVQQPGIRILDIRNSLSAISISADDLPTSLQDLSISYCPEITLSEPLQHKSLAKIYVSGCNSLAFFPLGALPNLKKLSISDCPQMDSLGDEFLSPSLTTLEITACQKLERGITSNGLQSFLSVALTHLILEKWNEVKSFPREGCLPASLQCLELWEFENLETLDCEGLHHLTSLSKLRIEGCPKLENITQERLPASIAKIRLGGHCPLMHKLEEMKDPRIESEAYRYVDWTIRRRTF